jgi:hypothetical protein
MLLVQGQNYVTLASVLKASESLPLPPSVATEPVTWKQAMAGPNASEWLAAASLRLQFFIDNDVFELVPRPADKTVIPNKPVFRVKFNQDGSVERFTVRVAARGDKQKAGIDYNEIFSPVVSYETLRLVLSIAASEDMEVIDCIDYSFAYVQAPLDEEVYTEQPQMMSDGRPDFVWRLKKSLEGLHQSGRQWYRLLSRTLMELGFKKVLSLPSCFILQRGDVKVLIPLYVDDKLLICNSRKFADGLIKDFAARHKLRHLGPATQILGIAIKRDREQRTITLSQPNYINKMLAKFGFADCKPRHTPMLEGLTLSKATEPMTDAERREMADVPYLQVIGSFMFAASTTRPDIAFTVHQLARYCSDPRPQHWAVAKHLFRYLRATIDFGLVLGGNGANRFTLEAFSDAAWGDCKDDGRSTSGYAVFLGKACVAWNSTKQPVVAKSTMEAELIGANKAGAAVIHLRNALGEIGYTQSQATSLMLDNTAAIKVAKEPEHFGRAKHIQLRWFWIREAVENNELRIGFVPTGEMVSDIFTKALGRQKHIKFAKALGLTGKLLEESSR